MHPVHVRDAVDRPTTDVLVKGRGVVEHVQHRRDAGVSHAPMSSLKDAAPCCKLYSDNAQNKNDMSVTPQSPTSNLRLGDCRVMVVSSMTHRTDATCPSRPAIVSHRIRGMWPYARGTVGGIGRRSERRCRDSGWFESFGVGHHADTLRRAPHDVGCTGRMLSNAPLRLTSSPTHQPRSWSKAEA